MRKVNTTLVVAIVLGLLLVEAAFGGFGKYKAIQSGRRTGAVKSQIKLDWQIDYSGEVGYENYFPQIVSVDKQGNIYLTAIYCIVTYNSNLNSMDYIRSLIRLDSNGNELWEIKYEDEDRHTQISFIDSDNQGNVYVSLSNEHSGKVRIAKYDKTGNFIWENVIVENYWSVRIPDIEIDGRGNIYISISKTIDNTIERYTFVKASSAGDVLWERNQDYDLNVFPGLSPLPKPISINSITAIMKVDRRGNVVTACNCNDVVEVTKYSKDGDLLWADLFEEEGYYFELYDAAVDNRGNIFVSIAESSTTSGPIEIRQPGIPIVNIRLGLPGLDANSFIVKYEPNGDAAFVLEENIPYQANLMVDRRGNIYVTGGDLSGNSEEVYNTIQKYDAEGNLKWSYLSTILYPPPLELNFNSYCINLDEQTGSLYILFQYSLDKTVLQKINTMGQVCYEKEIENVDYIAKCSTLKLIKTKKQGIYIFEPQGLRSSTDTYLDGPWLSKYVEKNVRGRRRAVKSERFDKRRR